MTDNNKIYIADFGIAYYNPEMFDMTGHTTESERLANYDFSAPEQRNSKIQPNKTMDIYAIGQIIQWLVFGVTTKGTHRKNLYQKFNTSRMHFLDNIVDKCLNDDPNNRFQSVDDILQEIETYNSDKTEINSKEVEIKISTSNRENKVNETKNALEDIMDKICYKYDIADNKDIVKNFYLMSQLSDQQVFRFLDNLSHNLNKLDFFDTVIFSSFINDCEIFDSYQIDKINFVRLNQLYNNIVNEGDSRMQLSLVEYVKTRLNDNYDLPF